MRGEALEIGCFLGKPSLLLYRLVLQHHRFAECISSVTGGNASIYTLFGALLIAMFTSQTAATLKTCMLCSTLCVRVCIYILSSWQLYAARCSLQEALVMAAGWSLYDNYRCQERVAY